MDRSLAAVAALTLFTAVEEQLGLKLETARGPVDVASSIAQNGLQRTESTGVA